MASHGSLNSAAVREQECGKELRGVWLSTCLLCNTADRDPWKYPVLVFKYCLVKGQLEMTGNEQLQCMTCKLSYSFTVYWIICMNFPKTLLKNHSSKNSNIYMKMRNNPKNALKLPDFETLVCLLNYPRFWAAIWNVKCYHILSKILFSTKLYG